MPGRVSWLLIAMLVLFFVTTASAEWRNHHTVENYRVWVQAIESVAYAIVLLAAGNAVADRRITVAVLISLAVLSIGAGLLAVITEAPLWSLAQSSATAVFLATTIVLIVRHLFRCREVDLDTLAAAVCVYLLFALLWLAFYSITVAFDPLSFEFPRVGDEVEPEQMTLQSMRSANGLYFSLVSLTTLGYGDVTPLSPVARFLAALEAVVGQVYLTILVARLVGLHLTTTVRAEDDLITQSGDDSERDIPDDDDSEHDAADDETATSMP